jgi:hypothetical protein
MQLDFGSSPLFQRQSPRKAQHSRRALTQEEQQEIEYAWKLLDAAGQGEVALKSLKVRWRGGCASQQHCRPALRSAALHAASCCPGSQHAAASDCPRPFNPRRWRCARSASPSRRQTCATC